MVRFDKCRVVSKSQTLLRWVNLGIGLATPSHGNKLLQQKSDQQKSLTSVNAVDYYPQNWKNEGTPPGNVKLENSSSDTNI